MTTALDLEFIGGPKDGKSIPWKLERLEDAPMFLHVRQGSSGHHRYELKVVGRPGARRFAYLYRELLDGDNPGDKGGQPT